MMYKTETNKITSICQPLKSLGFVFFLFVRAFKNSHCFHISNNEELTIQQRLYDLNKIVYFDYNYSNNFDKSIIYIDYLSKIKQVTGLTHTNFDLLDDCILLISKTEQYVDNIYFSSNLGSHLPFNDDLLCKLKRFYIYFIDQTLDILNEVKQNSRKLEKIKGVVIDFNQSIKNFSQLTPLSRFPLPNGLHLTKREIDCLMLLCKGLSYKEIGLYIHINERTVINHVENVKYKTGFRRQSELIRFCFANNLTSMFI